MYFTDHALASILEEPEIGRLFGHCEGFSLARKRERVIPPLSKRNQASRPGSHCGRKPALDFLSKSQPEEDGKAVPSMY